MTWLPYYWLWGRLSREKNNLKLKEFQRDIWSSCILYAQYFLLMLILYISLVSFLFIIYYSEKVSFEIRSFLIWRTFGQFQLQLFCHYHNGGAPVYDCNEMEVFATALFTQLINSVVNNGMSKGWVIWATLFLNLSCNIVVLEVETHCCAYYRVRNQLVSQQNIVLQICGILHVWLVSCV